MSKWETGEHLLTSLRVSGAKQGRDFKLERPPELKRSPKTGEETRTGLPASWSHAATGAAFGSDPPSESVTYRKSRDGSTLV